MSGSTLINVKPYYYNLLYSTQRWLLDCPYAQSHPEVRVGRVRVLQNLISDPIDSDGQKLYPFVFVNSVPLDNLTVSKWIAKYCDFIYDDTSLTNFLQQLGAYNTKRNLVAYSQVHQWRLDYGNNWERLIALNPKIPINKIKKQVFKLMYDTMNFGGLREILEAECSTP